MHYLRWWKHGSPLKVKGYRKHNLVTSKEWLAWKNMRQRCYNPKNISYKNYGARGIRVCSRWNDFMTFYNDMGKAPSPKHSLERIDNNSNYEPSNCRWATLVEQCNNRRSNRLITINGVTRTLQQWSNLSGINEVTIMRRHKVFGWPIEKAVFERRARNGRPISS